MTWLRTGISLAVVVASGVLAWGQVPATPGFNAASYGGAGAPVARSVPSTGARGAAAWQRIYVDGKMVVVPASPSGTGATPLPYLQYRRSITGRTHLTTYAPGYILAPQDKPKHGSVVRSTMASHPAFKQDERQTIYLDYYDPMPDVLANNLNLGHVVRGVPMPEWGKAYCPGCHAKLPSPLLWHDGACPQCAGYEDTAIQPGEAMRARRVDTATPTPWFEVIQWEDECAAIEGGTAAAVESGSQDGEEPAGKASSRQLPF